MLADFQHAAGLGYAHLGRFGNFLHSRFAAELLEQVLLMVRSLLMVSIMCTGFG